MRKCSMPYVICVTLRMMDHGFGLIKSYDFFSRGATMVHIRETRTEKKFVGSSHFYHV